MVSKITSRHHITPPPPLDINKDNLRVSKDDLRKTWSQEDTRNQEDNTDREIKSQEDIPPEKTIARVSPQPPPILRLIKNAGPPSKDGDTITPDITSPCMVVETGDSSRVELSNNGSDTHKLEENMKIVKRTRRTFTVNDINLEDIQKSGSKKSIVKTPGRMSPVSKTGLKKKKAEPSVDKMNSHVVM